MLSFWSPRSRSLCLKGRGPRTTKAKELLSMPSRGVLHRPSCQRAAKWLSCRAIPDRPVRSQFV